MEKNNENEWSSCVDRKPLTAENFKEGMRAFSPDDQVYIITQVLENGEFRALPNYTYESLIADAHSFGGSDIYELTPHEQAQADVEYANNWDEVEVFTLPEQVVSIDNSINGIEEDISAELNEFDEIRKEAESKELDMER